MKGDGSVKSKGTRLLIERKNISAHNMLTGLFHVSL